MLCHTTELPKPLVYVLLTVFAHLPIISRFRENKNTVKVQMFELTKLLEKHINRTFAIAISETELNMKVVYRHVIILTRGANTDKLGQAMESHWSNCLIKAI